MHRINSLIDESARHWNVVPRHARMAFWMPLVVALLLLAARIDKDVYRFLLNEDGPVEWGQFACFVIACGASAGVARRLLQTNLRWQAVLFFGLAFAMFFAAGEEVSWGQRVLGLETPESLREVNKQNELTLHNIGQTLSVFKMVMMIGGLLAGLAYLVNRKLRLQRYLPQTEFLFVPPFFLSSAFLFVFVYQFVRLVVPALRESSFTVTKYGEWSEFCLAFGIAVFVWLNRRRLAAASAAPETVISEDVPLRVAAYAEETCSLQPPGGEQP